MESPEKSKLAEDATVAYFLTKLRDLDDREKYLKAQLDTDLASIRSQRYTIQGFLQDVCSHSDQELIADWNYHNNVDESYQQCKICGKKL